MWLYKFLSKETRTQVPTYWTFLRSNHDTIKMWLENTTEPLNVRLGFSLRVIRWLVSFCLLFLILHVLINPQGSYYQKQCDKR